VICMNVHTAKQAELEAKGSTLAVTWSDCGDADTHAKVTDLQPSTVQTGATTPLVGTGTLDEDIAGATFSAKVKASGVQVASCDGDASQDVQCKLPLGAGSITLKALAFPIAAGQIPVTAEVKVSSLIPASLAVTNTHIEAVSDTGDKVVCLDVTTAKQAELEAKDIDCSTAVCQDQCTCSLEQCASEIDACLAQSACAKSQDCALACPCSDNACMLKCAAASPSIKALPVANCVNSKCGSASVLV